MAKNFQKAERNIKIDGDYKLLSYASSSESVEMSDGTDLQTKMNSVDSDISNEVSRATAKENEIANNLSSHTSNTSNPHSVTKAQVGLGNVENKSSATIRGEITKSNVTTALGYTPLNQSLKGSASGLAELDSNGKVPSSQLPSFVDDVVEGYLSGGKFYKESAHTTEISGETGKIYIDLSTEKTYRWSGSAFVVISETLALGETSSTAYRGDRGKVAYDHSQSTHARTDATKVEKSSTNGNIKINGTETTVYTHPSGTNPHGTTKSDVGLGNVGNFKAVSTVARQGLSDTEKSNARANIGAGTSSFSGSYNDLTNKPTIPTVGNGTITITQNGTTKGTFTTNQSGNTTIALTDNNTTYGVATQSANGLESAADKKKLDGIATGAEVNQNAFSSVVVGSTTISADSKTDSLTLVGSNVTLTPDADNDKVTIGITKANVTSALGYTPPTTNTTYGVATSSALGLVKSGTDITVDSSGNVSVNDDSHNHVISNVDGLQSALDSKYESSVSRTANTVLAAPNGSNGSASFRKLVAADLPSHGNHVPATQTANNAVFLRNDNTWQTVTPANIGAATSSHTHTKSQITDFPTSLPASDVYAWAKASSKPSYSWSEITNKPSTFTPASHTHSYLDKTNPTGTGSFSLNRKSGTIVGLCSTAEGCDTIASEFYSHAEGYTTTASGYASHAEGYTTTASGDASHAEGYHTTASGYASHAEGYTTTASGYCQHVQGKYNVADTTSAFIIGNGTSASAKSNAMTVDWNGNLKTAGDITNGSGVSLNSLNSNITWKRTDDYMTAYNGAINELLAIVWIQYAESGSNIVWSISIPKLAIDSTQRWYVSGHTLNNSTDFSGVALLISNTGFHNYQLNTQNIARAFHINWYYR